MQFTTESTQYRMVVATGSKACGGGKGCGFELSADPPPPPPHTHTHPSTHKLMTRKAKKSRTELVFLPVYIYIKLMRGPYQYAIANYHTFISNADIYGWSRPWQDRFRESTSSLDNKHLLWNRNLARYQSYWSCCQNLTLAHDVVW